MQQHAPVQQAVVDVGHGERRKTLGQMLSLGMLVAVLAANVVFLSFEAELPQLNLALIPLFALLGGGLLWLWRRRSDLHRRRLIVEPGGVTWAQPGRDDAIGWQELAMVGPAELATFDRRGSRYVYLLFRPAQPAEFWSRHARLAHLHYAENLVIPVLRTVFPGAAFSHAIRSWAPQLWNPGTQDTLRRGLQLTRAHLPPPP